MSSLRTRVALITTLVVAGAFLLTGLLVVGSSGRDARERLDEDLDRRLTLLTDAFPDGRGGPRPPGGTVGDGRIVDALRQAAQRSLGRGFFGLVTDAEGGRVAVVGDVPASLPPTGDVSDLQYTDTDGVVWRVRTAEVRAGGARISVGADVGRLVDEPLTDLVRRLVVLGGLAALMTGVVTAGVVTVATRPLGRLRDATTRVAGTEDLATRVQLGSAPREVQEVADGLNTMLARLEASTAAQAAALHGAQRFAADAGHELRTPLTAMQADLEALVRNPDAPAWVRQEALAEVSDEVRRLSGLLASLQSLARADSGAMPPSDAVDLHDLASTAVQAAATRFPGVTLTGPPDGQPVVVRGAEPWLRSIVDNLLANAALHGRRDGHVRVRVDRVADGVRLLVDDDGPGIPADQRAAVFSRFVRGADADDRPGSGLGLSLVAQLVALHGGTVAVEDSPLGGARLQVLLPPA